MKHLSGSTGTDLPVMLPFRPGATTWDARDWAGIATSKRFGFALALVLMSWILVDSAYAQMVGGKTQTVWETLVKWTPLVLFGPPREFGGFALNIAVSFLAMAIGTSMGLWPGPRTGIHKPRCPVRKVLGRHAVLPQLAVAGAAVLRDAADAVPDQDRRHDPAAGWLKATVGLALPIMANIAEIVRGAVNSIPTAQWESAESLAFTRLQTLWRIILPQCVKRMIPPWMNWYAILTMSTPLISIVGVNDAMTLTQDALASEQRTDLLMPMYGLLLFFFVYCYPIARWTIRLERKYAVRI